jgi:hypothetical protein
LGTHIPGLSAVLGFGDVVPALAVAAKKEDFDAWVVGGQVLDVG